MGITEGAVRNPAAVAVAVAIITLFGLFSLTKLPVQLFPNNRPASIECPGQLAGGFAERSGI